MYIAKQKLMVYPLAFSAHTPWSAALDFSSFVACLITKRAMLWYIQREMKGRQISARLPREWFVQIATEMVSSVTSYRSYCTAPRLKPLLGI